MSGRSRKTKSLFRSFVLADLITLANAGCGMAAIFLCIDYVTAFHRPSLWAVFVLLPIAGLCDFLDGLVARRLSRHSPFGADLDSLADIVSFGVAPAVLGFAMGLQGLWDALILIYFVVCGISRLARFNVTATALEGPMGKVKYYEGTPIPTSIIIVIVLGFVLWHGRVSNLMLLGSWQIGPWDLHPLTLLYAANGTTMVSSTIRIPKP